MLLNLDKSLFSQPSWGIEAMLTWYKIKTLTWLYIMLLPLLSRAKC